MRAEGARDPGASEPMGNRNHHAQGHVHKPGKETEGSKGHMRLMQGVTCYPLSASSKLQNKLGSIAMTCKARSPGS